MPTHCYSWPISRLLGQHLMTCLAAAHLQCPKHNSDVVINTVHRRNKAVEIQSYPDQGWFIVATRLAEKNIRRLASVKHTLATDNVHYNLNE